MTDPSKSPLPFLVMPLVWIMAAALAACAPLENTLPATTSPAPTITPAVSNFEECLAAGLPVMESYPRQCRTDDGKVFVEDIGNELEKTDLIRIDSPRPNMQIESPLVITGEARGFWFFEADFPIRLLDDAGNEIALTIAQAKADWMTEEFVPFEATLTFSAPSGTRATLVLEKDNPSDLPENADALVVPVIVK